MMNTPEYIRETLELYDRGELDPSRLLEVQALLRSDLAWQAAWKNLRSDTAGIRLNRLKTNLSVLEFLEAELKDPEKKTPAEGDPGAVLTSSPESNQIKQASETSLPENMEEIIDRKTSEGIRYSRLHQALNGLKAEEKKTADSRPASGRILGMRRIWLGAIAAGLLALTVLIFSVNDHISTNNYLLEHFDQYILHENSRSDSMVNDHDLSIGYNLYVIKDFNSAIPYLLKNWENKKDTLSLFYLYVSYEITGDYRKSSELKSKILTFNNFYTTKLNH